MTTQTLAGILDRITYRNDSDGFTIARVRPNGKDYTVTATGKLAGVQVGEALELDGRWVDHPEHGRQFEIARYRSVLPATVEGIRRYLGSGLVKGVGPSTAKKITDAFGSETLQILENEPQRLAQVPGLGRKKAELIARAWDEQREIKQVMLFLQDLDISPTVAIRIYRQYGDGALGLIQQNPYRLADEIAGIGFLTADKIAQGMGVALDSPVRVAAGLRFALSEASNDGHCSLPWEELVDQTAKLLTCDAAMVAATLDAATIARQLHLETFDNVRYVALMPLYFAEKGVAERIGDLLRAESPIAGFFERVNWIRVFSRLEQRGIALTERQQDAVRTALTNKVSVLTGGPGTGKTTCLRTLILALEQRNYRYRLAAPTGRAARRLAEATGAEAGTIHRLLEYTPIGGGGFKRNPERPLECEVVIIDEASMLDVLLANQLLKAIPPEAHLLLVGDPDQLPSVGPGRVLRDIIDSGAVPAVHLDTIFRQAEGSGIISNAHRINAGEMPQTDGVNDFFVFPAAEPERCAALVVDLVTRRVPQRFELQPNAIQVLTPMHKGPAGVTNLNTLLQDALNPAQPNRPELRGGGGQFRLGDRVMQQRNNYDLEVSNGDIGTISGVDLEAGQLTVNFDGARRVTYDTGQLDELTLAYAISVHKSQGGEYPCIVMPLLMQHYALLQRNLLYTGVTRASQVCVLVGDRRAIATAVATARTDERYTALARRLHRASGVGVR